MPERMAPEGMAPERAKARHRGGDRGEVASTVVMVPLAMLLFLVAVQIALTFHARSVLSAAAQDYVRAVQTEQPGSGEAAAANVLSGSTHLFTSTPAMAPTTGGDVVSVTITGQVKSVVPGWSPEVTATAEGAAERFRPPSER